MISALPLPCLIGQAIPYDEGMRWLCPLLLILALTAGWTPLDESERASLSSMVVDGQSQWDGPGVRKMLERTMTWEPTDFEGATLYRWSTMYDRTAELRGNIVLIEGELVRTLARETTFSGPWGRHVTEWLIRPHDDDQESLVVLLPDPDGSASQTKIGSSVRIPAVFIKTWVTRNERQPGEPATYLVFVGPRTAEPVNDSPTQQEKSSSNVQFLVLLLALGGVAFWRLRRVVTKLKRPVNSQRRKLSALGVDDATTDASDNPDTLDTDEPEPLSDDPVKALEELANRHESADLR